MMSIFIFLILFLIGTHGKFLFNPASSSFIVLRHIRLSTDNEQYRIRCPYNLNHLNLQLLNYSNDDCFNLYSGSDNNHCHTQQSPCQFHAKSVQLHCNHHSYSNYVDITYQCSYKNTKETYSQTIISDSSNNQDEIISLFLIGLGIVITIWIFICCIWFICCHDNEDDDDDDDDKNPPRSYSRPNLSLHLNPFETNRISSSRTSQSV